MKIPVLDKSRCAWVTDDPLYVQYHDTEWGVPVHDDRKLFEFILLDGMQAGLSWLTVLRKRENFRAAFDNFDAEKIAGYGESTVSQLLNDPGIIRNRLKIEAAVRNARAFLAVQEEFDRFDTYIWGFVGSKTLQNSWRTSADVPVKSLESDAMSRDLVQRGFKFVGPTICYAFMQAAGLLNDHTTDCFRHAEVAKRLRRR